MIQIGKPAATIDSPIEHLVACHRRIEQRLETLVNAAGHLEDKPEEALSAIRNSLKFLDTSGTSHTEDEESSLFPRLRPKLSAPELAFLESLEAQHDEADALSLELKELTLRLSSACSAETIQRYRNCAEKLRELYRDHIRSEDEILTTMARRSLDAAELDEISREMRNRRG